MAENRKLKVFLCHSKDDKLQVREIYNRLIADGFDAWLDEEKLLPGQEWDFEIQKAVRESHVVVVCLSNGSITKAGYIQKEIRFALDVADQQPEGAIYLIPARLEDCEVPSRLTKWQWVNLFEVQGYKRLKVSLEIRAEKLDIAGIFYNRFELSHLPFEAPQMVHIPAGKFLMGTTLEQAAEAIKNGANKEWVEYEQPQHEVQLSEYFIDKYPVTNAQYQIFVQDAKYEPLSGWNGKNYPPQKSDHPVVHVSWNDAQAYCQWLSQRTGKPYRLPTEAEWEKAARGPLTSSRNGRVYPWGADFDPKKCNVAESKIGSTTPVGQFSQTGGDSPYGCADMAGNVWEWCADWFDENEYKNRARQAVKDPFGPQKGGYRVMRGGSWHSHPYSPRCAARRRNLPADFDDFIGFRVVHSPSFLISEG